MKCPVDERELVMSERQGIEIDYCPSCRGVWLDRGELDKIVERAAEAQSPPSDRRSGRDRDDDRDDRRRSEKRDTHDDDRGMFGRKKKKESFLSELFEFGG